MLGEVGTWIAIWWPVMSEILVPKIIKIRLLILSNVTVVNVGVPFLRHSVPRLGLSILRPPKFLTLLCSPGSTPLASIIFLVLLLQLLLVFNRPTLLKLYHAAKHWVNMNVALLCVVYWLDVHCKRHKNVPVRSRGFLSRILSWVFFYLRWR